MRKGSLYLFPSPLGMRGSQEGSEFYTSQTCRLLKDVSLFLCERIRTTRRILSSLGLFESMDALRFASLSTSQEDMGDYVSFLRKGMNMGFFSEVGVPILADPGAILVARMHQEGIKVFPCQVPSAIVMTLMGSGFSGQRFYFAGYLSRDKRQRRKALKDMSMQVEAGITQLFIETPYRNAAVFEDILQYCPPRMHLCLGIALGSVRQHIITLPISDWKGKKISIHRVETTFSLGYFAR